MMNIEEIIGNIDSEALLNSPATDRNIELCNSKLSKNNLPPLPAEFVAFLKICNGMEYNGMQIFGTKRNQVVNFTVQNQVYYERFDDIKKLIFFGCIDDDIYTYNTQTRKYEARDICGFDIWDTYDSFYDFFFHEMMKWLR